LPQSPNSSPSTPKVLPKAQISSPPTSTPMDQTPSNAKPALALPPAPVLPQSNPSTPPLPEGLTKPSCKPQIIMPPIFTTERPTTARPTGVQ
jgi:hypothetical protein